MRMFRFTFALAVLLAINARADELTGIVVNGVELTQEAVLSLERNYRIRIADVELSDEQIAAVLDLFGIELKKGHFWYDSVSGAWGYEGLPPAGRIQPNLPVEGELRADASNGTTDVIVNGRILHQSEYDYLLRRFGYVIPGRYYLLPNGSYGFEGGPIMGNLVPQWRPSIGGDNKFGTAIGGDGITGYIPPNHGGTRTPMVTCGPDGGCMF